MANAKLELRGLKETNRATLEFEGREYAITYTTPDATKLSAAYASLVKALENMSDPEKVSADGMLETFGESGPIFTESVALIRKILGQEELDEIISAAGVELDFNALSLIVIACVNAVSNSMQTARKADVEAELVRLDNV